MESQRHQRCGHADSRHPSLLASEDTFSPQPLTAGLACGSHATARGAADDNAGTSAGVGRAAAVGEQGAQTC